MNESVTLQVIVEPCGTEAVCEVSVPLPDTETFALAVVYDPSSILYSTFTYIVELSLLVIVKVEVCDPLLQLPKEPANVASGSQSTADVAVCSSKEAPSKLPSVLLSLNCQVIVEPCGTETDKDVSVALAATERLVAAV